MNKNGRFPHILFISLTFLFGLQTLRILFSLSLYVLRDRFGWTAIQIGILMAAFFALSFLAGLFRRWLGTERMVIITAVATSLFRLMLQFWSGDPLIDLILAFLTIFSFMLFVPVALGYMRSQGLVAVQDFAVGMLLGVAFDVALHGAFRTYDMAWQNNWLTAVITLILVISQWVTIWPVLFKSSQEATHETDTTLGLGLSWLTFGPFLFLQLLIFSNLARLTVLTGWGQATAFLIMVMAQLLGVLILALLFNRNGGVVRPLFVGILGLLLVAILVMPWPTGGLAALQLLLGQLLLALLTGVLIVAIGVGNGRSGLRNLTLGNGLAWLLMAIFTFLYYAGYDIPLPFSNDLLFPLAALLIAICAFFAARTIPQATSAPKPRLGWAMLLVLLLLVLPLVQFLDQPATAVPGDGYPVRIMTYNLHNGFDMMGYLGLEALAQVIEAENPDVVGLQEINRGWVVNGSTDMLAWLSRRLDMPYVWQPTTGELWGNAVLSRLPLTDVDLQTLPPPGMLLGRGFIWANVVVGNGEQLAIIDTHYHHKEDDSAIRVEQSQAILDYWAERPFTLIMGDLNAEPAAPEIQLLENSGFQSVLDLLGIQPGYTYDAHQPSHRLDHIFITPDLSPAEAIILTQPASDHLPVVTTIQR
ncbi:MAG: endonuclease/exonuclease/phosphatase family protein [Anaerolineae bacterium]|nr:endonuclease/exonuclease/phosphatase family protein [Anaerolineae bacterium]